MRKLMRHVPPTSHSDPELGQVQSYPFSPPAPVFSPRPVLRFGLPRQHRRNHSLSLHIPASSVGRRVTRSLFNFDVEGDETTSPIRVHFAPQPASPAQMSAPLTTPQVDSPDRMTGTPASPISPAMASPPLTPRTRSRVRPGARLSHNEPADEPVVFKTIGLEGLPTRWKRRR